VSIDDLGGAVFFAEGRPPLAAHPSRGNIAREQLDSAPGDGAGVDAEQLGDLGVAAVADLHGLEAGVETTLALIEQAVKEHDGGLEHLGEHPQPWAEGKAGGLGGVHRARTELGTARRGVRRQVDVATRHLLARQAS